MTERGLQARIRCSEYMEAIRKVMIFFPLYWEFLKINACVFSPENGLYLLSGCSSMDRQLSLHITLNKKRNQVDSFTRQLYSNECMLIVQ